MPRPLIANVNYLLLFLVGSEDFLALGEVATGWDTLFGDARSPSVSMMTEIRVVVLAIERAPPTKAHRRRGWHRITTRYTIISQ